MKMNGLPRDKEAAEIKALIYRLAWLPETFGRDGYVSQIEHARLIAAAERLSPMTLAEARAYVQKAESM